jgi:hypothetical protein
MELSILKILIDDRGCYWKGITIIIKNKLLQINQVYYCRLIYKIPNITTELKWKLFTKYTNITTELKWKLFTKVIK